MTTIEKLNAIPKVVYVTREQYGMPEYDVYYGDYGYAAFKLDMNVHDEGVNLFYAQRHNGEYYGLREPYISRMKLLERIFGSDFFKEEE